MIAEDPMQRAEQEPCASKMAVAMRKLGVDYQGQ
jgi:hypothetical protein